MAQSASQKGRPIAIFGGTFDPIHSGHMTVAHAAMQRLNLDAIYFVTSGNPPHKPKTRPAPFVHRYAMVALACSGHRGYIASLAEAPDPADADVCYSLDTVKMCIRDRHRDQIPTPFPGEQVQLRDPIFQPLWRLSLIHILQ